MNRLLLLTCLALALLAASGLVILVFEMKNLSNQGTAPLPTMDTLAQNWQVQDQTPETDPGSGYKLAAQQCSRCHQLPTPDDLPFSSWPFVLDAMGNYLGFSSPPPQSKMVFSSLLPKSQLVSKQNFEAIRQYYLSNAPDQDALKRSLQKVPPQDLGIFEVVVPPVELEHGSLVSMVRYDSYHRNILVGTDAPPKLDVFDRLWHQQASLDQDSPPVDAQILADGFRIDDIGDMWGVDTEHGSVREYDYRPGEASRSVAKEFSLHTLVEHYYRLSSHDAGDLDGDGNEDLVLAGYGQGTDGRVSIFWGRTGGGYDEQLLLTRAGAVSVRVLDLEGTGRPDILVLMAQGRNELLLFRNLGDRHFQQLQLKEWSPSFGASGMCLADIYGDGRQDIVLVNGNGVNLPDCPLKSKQGIHVLRNRGNLQFDESFFYPMYGATAVGVADFTGEGRLDIAAASFFPDWSSPHPETFTWLEQQSSGQFIAHTLGTEHLGRWRSLEIADLDGDGRPDVILGGGFSEIGLPGNAAMRIAKRLEHQPRLLVLHNRGRTAAQGATSSLQGPLRGDDAGSLLFADARPPASPAH